MSDARELSRVGELRGLRGGLGRALVVGAALAGLSALGACQPAEQEVTDATAVEEDVVARGEYLVTIGGCHDCHTPWKMGPQGPAPDMERALIGHPQELEVASAPELGDGPWMWAGSMTNTAFAGPWGITYAPNLTPDEATGMGIWTEEMFVQAMRTGKHMGQSRPIMPPMPWPNLAQATDEDLVAIYAYLRSLPPVSNRVPAYQPPEGAPEGLPAEPATAPDAA